METREFVKRVVAVALAMPVDKPCPNDGCDDGWMMKSDGEPCPVCDPYNTGPGGLGTIPNAQRARLLEAFGCRHGDGHVAQCVCGGTGYVPKDFSVLDSPDLMQARIGLARVVYAVMGWMLQLNGTLADVTVFDNGYVILGSASADAPDAAAFDAVLGALEGAK